MCRLLRGAHHKTQLYCYLDKCENDSLVWKKREMTCHILAHDDMILRGTELHQEQLLMLEYGLKVEVDVLAAKVG